jgi:hypothetical protein
MNKKMFFLCAISLLVTTSLFAQDAVRDCAADDKYELMMQQDPAFAARMMEIESFTQNYLATHEGGTRTVVTIPVVVHVVYNGATENVSDAQINTQMDVLNEDFRRLNADASSTLATFLGVAADAEIEFCLASVDPAGGATTGITRTSTSETSFSYISDDVKFNASGGKDAWPADDYMNMWVCDISGGILGYAQFPGGADATDGVVIDYEYFGTIGTATSPFDLGRTATHEVGHWLNLRHIWGDGGCGVDDFCADTPESDGPNYGCNLSATSCSTLDMVQNYMDYTDDDCMNLFSEDQKSRMHALFAAGGARESLLTSGACGGVVGGGCDVPTGLTSSSVSATSATLSWSPVAGATNYRLQIEDDATGVNRRGKTASTTVNLGPGFITPGTTYAWGVKAICADGTSDWAGPAYFTTPVRQGVGIDYNMVIYPNPANGSFYLRGWTAENTTASVVITDLTGRVVSSTLLDEESSMDPHPFNMTLPAGMYIVLVNGDNTTYQENLIIG